MFGGVSASWWCVVSCALGLACGSTAPQASSSPDAAKEAEAGPDDVGDARPPADAGRPDARPPADAGTSSDLPPPVDAGGARPAACAPRAILSRLGGTVLGDWDLVVITASNDTEAGPATDALTALASSSWLRDQAAAYGAGPPAATLTWMGPAIAPTPANPSPTDGFSEQDVRSYLAALVGANAASDRSRVYVLLLPAGVRYARGAALGDPACSGEGGYHNYFVDSTSAQRIYAVLGRCDQSTSEDPARVRGAIASHEIIEAVTDPFGDGFRLQDDSPWARSGGTGWVENADLCAGTRIEEGGRWYQRNWSNAAAAASGDPCSPTSPDGYYSVCAPVDWTPVASGGHTSIELVPWSTRQAADWQVGGATAWVSSAQPTYRWQLRSVRTTTIEGTTILPVVNVGETLAIDVDVGADAPSGFAVVLSLFSARRRADGTFADPGDRSHEERIGFYVP